MQVTLDGLLRALRWRAHTLAEDIAQARGQTGRQRPVRPKRPAGNGASRMEDPSDDRARR